jgi:hypothetical protein
VDSVSVVVRRDRAKEDIANSDALAFSSAIRRVRVWISARWYKTSFYGFVSHGLYE